MMKFLVINGPNINMLGIREPDIYGAQNYSELLRRVKEKAEDLYKRYNSGNRT